MAVVACAASQSMHRCVRLSLFLIPFPLPYTGRQAAAISSSLPPLPAVRGPASKLTGNTQEGGGERQQVRL